MTYEESLSDKKNCCLAGGIYEAAIPCRLGLSASTINANPLSGHFPPAVHLPAEVNSSPPSMGSPGVIQDFVLHVFFFCQRCGSKNSDRSTEASRMRNDAKTCKKVLQKHAKKLKTAFPPLSRRSQQIFTRLITMHSGI